MSSELPLWTEKLTTSGFDSKMVQFGFSKRTRRVVINFGFSSIEEIRDFINENGMESLRKAKAWFGRIVCEELTRIPFLFQTFEEAKKLIPLVESLQVEIEQYDLILDEAKKLPEFNTLLETIKSSTPYLKLEAKKWRA